MFKKPEKKEKEPEKKQPPRIDKDLVLCECGIPVVGESHQCWGCSHRS
jgi:hypothetical protein